MKIKKRYISRREILGIIITAIRDDAYLIRCVFKNTYDKKVKFRYFFKFYFII